MDKQELINEMLLEVERLANTKDVKIKLIDLFRMNLEVWEKRLFVAWKYLNIDVYGGLSKMLISLGYEKATAKMVSVYLVRVRKEYADGKIKFQGIAQFEPKRTKPIAPLNSSLHSTQSRSGITVTPTLEVAKPEIEKVGLPISVEVVSTPQNVVAALPQKRVALSKDDPIHHELPPGLTAEEQEKVARWYDISWIGEEPDWNYFLTKDYYKTLFTAKWDDEKENLWRHVLKMAREKYGMTESELTTATYFQRKSTKEFADLRGGLANIRARNVKQYLLSPFREGKNTRRNEGV